MIPTLYDSDVTKLKNGGLGKGKLAEATRCVVHEELNGDFSLELDYPVNGAYYSDLVEGGMIGAHFPFPADYLYDRGVTDIKEQWFDVVGHDMSIEGIDTIKALHISRRLADYVCIPNYINSWSSITGNMYPTDTGGIRWSINGSISGGFRLTTPKSALSCLIGESESVVNDLGGDAMFYTKRGYLDSQSRLGVYFQQVYPKRGGDFGAQIRFGINMLSLDHTRDKIGAYNAVVPFWESNGSFTYVTGYIVQPTTPISPVVAVPLDLSNDFDSQPTNAQMVQAARDHLDTLQPWLGTSTIKVDFLNDKDIDVNAVAINLGDTIHVYWGDADIATDLRVVAYDYDVLAERYISLELGTPQTQYVAVTGESYAGASGGGSGGGGGNSDYTIYDSVTDIGLTSGSATIAGAYSAMPNNSILLCSLGEFSSDQRPLNYTSSIIEIFKGEDGSHSWIEAKGDTSGYSDYRMFFSSGVPTGTWVKQMTETDINGLLSVTTKQINISSLASGGVVDTSVSVARSGYTVIGVVGTSRGGTGNTQLNIGRMYTSGNTLYYSVRNLSSGSLSNVSMTYYILYRKNL